MNRVSGGLEVAIFAGCFVALMIFRMSVRDTVATAPAKTLPMKMPLMPQSLAIQAPPAGVTTAPAIDPAPDMEPRAAVAMGAPFVAEPRPVVDAASKLKLDYAYARERCLAKLRETEQYRRVEAEVAALEIQVRALRQDDPRDQLPAVSVRWITAKSELSALTQAALREDPDVRAAESVLRAAGFIQPVFPMRSNPLEVDSDSPRVQADPGAAGD